MRDPKGLDMLIEMNGSNISTGEKQLICISRAILRKTNVILLDEATANIDVNTEEILQTLIKEEFKHATVITIAHRLNTIMSSDKILVLSMGEAVEFDSPENLMNNPMSVFSSLLKDVEAQER